MGLSALVSDAQEDHSCQDLSISQEVTDLSIGPGLKAKTENYLNLTAGLDYNESTQILPFQNKISKQKLEMKNKSQ